MWDSVSTSTPLGNEPSCPTQYVEAIRVKIAICASATTCPLRDGNGDGPTEAR